MLRFVGEASVYKGDVRAAGLSRTDSGRIRFSYFPEYSGPDVAFTLPVSAQPMEGSGLPAFFAGLLPEGHRLSVLRRATKTSLDDELILLLAVGADTPGDVRVLPGDTPPERASPVVHEDAAQVMGILPAATYTVTSVGVVQALAARCDAPVVAARNLYLQFVFAWLTGNGDLHAKNVSVLRAWDGRWAVAPVYDIPCTALYRDMSLALLVAGRVTNLRLRHWEEFAESIGLPERAARRTRELALKVASGIDLSLLPFDGSPLRGAERELRFRRHELSAE